MIRPATADDLPRLLALEVECFGTSAWSAVLVQGAIDDPAQDVRVTATGEAYAVVRVVDDTADLDRIAVAPSARRTGLARDLLHDLTGRAVARGARRMLLEVAADNPGALALYRSAGFEEIHRRRRYYAGGVDAVIMQRPLAD